MNVTEGATLTTAAPGPVKLKGGRYLFSAAATWNGGSVELQGMLPDNATYATVPTVTGVPALLSATVGWLAVDLTPGQYRLQIITAASVTAIIASVPV